MKALTTTGFGGPEVLHLVDQPVPAPGRTSVLIEVAASTVNWIDVSAREGRLHQAGMSAVTSGLGLGWDVAGTVTAVGAGVEAFQVGDRVIGLRDLLFRPGTQATHVVLDANAISHAPRSIDLIQAAALPLAGLTAMHALDLTGLRPGQWLLITGGSGEVGRTAAALARQRGLSTLVHLRSGDTDAPAADHLIVDTDHLADEVRGRVDGGADAVIDAGNQGILALDALRSTGRFVALVRPLAPPPIRGTTVHVAEVHADSGGLAALASLVDAGLLAPRVAATFPLDRAAEAYQAFERGGSRGRVMITPEEGP